MPIHSTRPAYQRTVVCSAGSVARASVRLAMMAILLFAVVADIKGAVVYRKGNPKPVAGFIVEQTPGRVVLRTTRSDATTEQSISRDDIVAIVVCAEEAELAELSPDQPKKYLEIAERVVQRKGDPEAVELAVRCYLLAAYHGRDELRDSALRGLIAAARSTEEQTKFRALAHQTNPISGDPWLSTVVQNVELRVELDQAARSELLQVVRLIRQGETELARNRLRSQDFRTRFEAFADIMNYRDLESALLEEKLTSDQLKSLVKLELALVNQGHQTGPTNVGSLQKTDAWQTSVNRGAIEPIQGVSWHTVTEFDPEEAIFTKGKWSK